MNLSQARAALKRRPKFGDREQIDAGPHIRAYDLAVELRKQSSCPTCNGNGSHPPRNRCDDCEGTGCPTVAALAKLPTRDLRSVIWAAEHPARGEGTQ